MTGLIDFLQGVASLTLIVIGGVAAVTWFFLGMLTEAGTRVDECFPRHRDAFLVHLLLWLPVAVVGGIFVAAAGRAL